MPDEPIINIVLRVPQSVHTACTKQAAKAHRSLNWQLVTMLE
jgi:hypothetical protein